MAQSSFSGTPKLEPFGTHWTLQKRTRFCLLLCLAVSIAPFAVVAYALCVPILYAWTATKDAVEQEYLS